MSMSSFMGLSNALLASFQASPPLAGGHVFQNRMRALPLGVAQAVVIRLVQTAGHEVVLGFMDYQTQFAIEVYGRADTGTDPAGCLDQLLLDVWARLMTITAEDLNAMALGVDPVVGWDFDEKETPLACAIVHLTVSHRTPFNNLAA